MAGKAKAEATTAVMGRPTIFSQELADRLCEELALGRSLRSVCADEDMPAIRTVFYWMRSNPEFLQQYTRAKEEATDALADEIQDIADDARNDWMEQYVKGQKETILNREHVERSKLRIETRKWLMAKMKPKRYGDKLDMTTDGKALPAPLFGGLSVNLNAKDDD